MKIIKPCGSCKCKYKYGSAKKCIFRKECKRDRYFHYNSIHSDANGSKEDIVSFLRDLADAIEKSDSHYVHSQFHDREIIEYNVPGSVWGGRIETGVKRSSFDISWHIYEDSGKQMANNLPTRDKEAG